MKHILFLILLFSVSAKAQRFDDFLKSLQEKLPLNTERMRFIIDNHKTRLAHPSLLEKHGIINSSAAAAYNGFLNTIILKENMTTAMNPNQQEQSPQRMKNWQEIRKAEPVNWSLTMGTMFHELSHAEYNWIQDSQDPVDQELVTLLNGEFRDYLSENHPDYNLVDRIIAPSELFAYFRGDFLMKMFNMIDQIFMNNGYSKNKKNCYNFQILRDLFDRNRDLNPLHFLYTPVNEVFAEMELPTIWVRSKGLVIKKDHPIAAKLKAALWKQFAKNFKAPADSNELIDWMNSGPRLLRLIKPCRDHIVVELESIDNARFAAEKAAAEAAAEIERRMMDHR